MSLTSYRAAPPRAGVGRDRGRSRQRRQTDESAAFLRQKRRALVVGDCKEADVVLGRSGDDLLSRVLRHSTIGAEAFNGRVRDGIGFLSPRSDHRTGQRQQQGGRAPSRTSSGSKQFFRSFSINLNAPGSQIPKARPGAADVSADSQGNGRSRRRLRPMFKSMSNGQGS